MLNPDLSSHPPDEALRQRVADELIPYPQWSGLREALIANHPHISWYLNTSNACINAIRCQWGSPARLLGQSQPHADCDSFLANIINPLIRTGELTDGSLQGTFDDRKVRWSNVPSDNLIDERDALLELKVAPSCFQHCKQDIDRSSDDALRMMLLGIQQEANPYLYFARGIGVCIIPLTQEGSAFIGKRANTQEYSNSLSFVSGWASFCTEVKDINLFRDASREIQEEIHYPEQIDSSKLQFIGISGHPLTGEADLVFLFQSDLHDEYFYSRSWPEHSAWLPLRTCKEATNLLHHGFLSSEEVSLEVMFSSRTALEHLISHKVLA